MSSSLQYFKPTIDICRGTSNTERESIPVPWPPFFISLGGTRFNRKSGCLKTVSCPKCTLCPSRTTFLWFMRACVCGGGVIFQGRRCSFATPWSCDVAFCCPIVSARFRLPDVRRCVTTDVFHYPVSAFTHKVRDALA